MPRRWVELCATGAFWLSRGGSQESYGLPTPKFGLFGVSNLPPVLCLISIPCPLHVTHSDGDDCLFGSECASHQLPNSNNLAPVWSVHGMDSDIAWLLFLIPSNPEVCPVTLQTHPTVNPGAGDILQLIKKKKVTPKPGILCYNDNTVTFMDGTTEEVDAVVCATGMGRLLLSSFGKATCKG